MPDRIYSLKDFEPFFDSFCRVDKLSNMLNEGGIEFSFTVPKEHWDLIADENGKVDF